MAADPKAIEKVPFFSNEELTELFRTVLQSAPVPEVEFIWESRRNVLHRRDPLLSRTCLSCGAKTDPYGNLPCGH